MRDRVRFEIERPINGTGCGTPREAATAKNALLFLIQAEISLAIILAEFDGAPARVVVTWASD